MKSLAFIDRPRSGGRATPVSRVGQSGGLPYQSAVRLEPRLWAWMSAAHMVQAAVSRSSVHSGGGVRRSRRPGAEEGTSWLLAMALSRRRRSVWMDFILTCVLGGCSE